MCCIPPQHEDWQIPISSGQSHRTKVECRSSAIARSGVEVGELNKENRGSRAEESSRPASQDREDGGTRKEITTMATRE